MDAARRSFLAGGAAVAAASAIPSKDAAADAVTVGDINSGYANAVIEAHGAIMTLPNSDGGQPHGIMFIRSDGVVTFVSRGQTFQPGFVDQSVSSLVADRAEMLRRLGFERVVESA